MEEQHNELPRDSDDLLPNIGTYDPKLDLSTYEYLPLDLLPEPLRELMHQIRVKASQFILPLLLDGKEEPVFRELHNHPNVLLAGTIASGKTQFIYNQLICWLYTRHPAEIKFVICRSKPVDYNSIASVERHFLAKLPGESSAIVEGGQVFRTINALNIECEARLNLFKKAGVKNIQDYNKGFIQRILNPVDGHRYMPDIIILLDDLSTFLDNDTSTALIRLTQQNLYTGIYLIAVTSQITSRNISQQLRANFSVRLSMKLMSQNESRKILERVGAEKLMQPGELLYQVGDTLRKGIQPLIEYKDIIRIVEFIGNQPGYPSVMLLPEYIDMDSPPIGDFDINDHDPMFEDAARLVVLHQQGSPSLIQRKLKLGYNRAGRIIDQLEAVGIVGPFEGSKAREVLFPDEYSLEMFLDGLKGDGSVNKVTHQAKSTKPAIVRGNLPKRHSIKGNSFRTGKHELTIAAKTPKINAPSKPDKSRTNAIVWVIILFIALLIFLVGGWEGLVEWVR